MINNWNDLSKSSLTKLGVSVWINHDISIGFGRKNNNFFHLVTHWLYPADIMGNGINQHRLQSIGYCQCIIIAHQNPGSYDCESNPIVHLCKCQTSCLKIVDPWFGKLQLSRKCLSPPRPPTQPLFQIKTLQNNCHK